MMSVEFASAQKDAEPVRHDAAVTSSESALGVGVAGTTAAGWLGHEILTQQSK
jgi:hypothetical protein